MGEVRTLLFSLRLVYATTHGSHDNSRVVHISCRFTCVRRAPSLNVALVGASLDLEETQIAPSGGPAVGNKPIVSTGLGAPADHLDGVATLWLCFVTVLLVDTRFVGHEALVHQKCNLDWPVGHDLLLHIRNTFDRVGTCSLASCK